MRYYIVMNLTNENAPSELFIGSNYELAHSTLKTINKGYIIEFKNKLSLTLREDGRIFMMKGLNSASITRGSY